MNFIDMRQEAVVVERSFLQRVFAWMFIGLLITAAVSLIVATNDSLFDAANSGLLYVAIFAELGVVLLLSFAVNRLSAGAVTALFVGYAALNGFTLSIILVYAGAETVTTAFVATACLFGALAIIGATTNMDLQGLGTYLLVGLIGLIVVSILNIFLASNAIDWLVCIAGVVIFTGLTAYDVQRISRITHGNQKMAIMAALRLYLDFINLFIYLLRIMMKLQRR
ncbi:MAG: membrane protein [Chloroflexota bacterium]|nr:MAG: membrane protein [Chloroflexota bacterium]